VVQAGCCFGNRTGIYNVRLPLDGRDQVVHGGLGVRLVRIQENNYTAMRIHFIYTIDLFLGVQYGDSRDRWPVAVQALDVHCVDYGSGHDRGRMVMVITFS
jgi:hypothetical protein